MFILLVAKRTKAVITVESNPKNFEYLKGNVRLNEVEKVVLINRALSNYVGD